MTSEAPKNSAFISHGAIWQTDELEVERLKAVTLLYDKMVFAGPDGLGQARLEHAMGEENTGAATRTEILSLACGSNDVAPTFSIYGLGEGTSEWPWDSAPLVLRDATREVLSDAYGWNVASEDAGESYEGHKHGGYTMSDVLYWNSYFSDAAFVGDIYAEKILKRISADEPKDALKSKWSEATTDVFTALSWDDIFELRRSPYLNAFRAKFAEVSATGSADQIISHYHAALEELAGLFEPNVKKEAAIGVLGNIPGLPINPIAVGASVAAVRKAKTTRDKYGWVFFLRQAREVGDNRQQTT